MESPTTNLYCCFIAVGACLLISAVCEGQQLDNHGGFLTNLSYTNLSLDSSLSSLRVIHLLRLSSMIETDIGFQAALDVFRVLPRWNNRFAIKIVTRKTNRTQGKSIATALRLSLESLEKTNNTYVAMLGPDYTSEAEPVTQITPIYYLNSMSMSSSEKFRDTSAFPLMFRIEPRFGGVQKLIVGLLEKLDIRRVFTLAFREQLFAENMVQFADYWSAKENCSITRAAIMGLDDLHDKVKYLVADELAVDYIVASTGVLLPYAMCEIYKSSAHMTVRPTVFELQTYDVREIWQSALNDPLFNCTFDEMRSALNGSVFTVLINPKFVTDEYSLTRLRHDGMTLERIQQYLHHNAEMLGKSPDTQSYFTYDSAIALYTALYRTDVRMEQSFGVRLHQIDKRTTTSQLWSVLATILHDEIAATSFDGVTSADLVRFDKNQNRIGGRELVQYQDFDLEENYTVSNFVQIATFNSVTNDIMLNPNLKLKFHTLTGEAPHVWRRSHAPLLDQNLLQNGQFTKTVVLIMVAVFAVFLVIMGCLAYWLLRRVKQKANTRQDLSWLIAYADLTYKASEMSSSFVRSRNYGQRSNLSFSDTASTTISPVPPTQYIHTKTAAKLFIRKVTVNVVTATTSNAADLNRVFLPAAAMHRLAHDNVNRFFGICLDFRESPLSVDRLAVLAFEYRPNRSLAELLENTDWLEADVGLRLFSMVDCARGVLALHSANIIHGFLNTWNILLGVDLTVKITDYGLENFGRSQEKLQPVCHTDHWSDEALEKLAFRSPEQIRDGFHGCNMLKSDIYSVGVVLAHILSMGQLPEFANAAGKTFSYKTVTNEYASFAANDYSIPVIHENDGPLALRNIISDCTTRVADRPKISEILKRLTSMPEYGARSLVETLVFELQRQTADLESVVAERTDALLRESSRNDQLLAQILPLSVATKLKAGSAVPPETFDRVSVYFSDIDGFLKLSARWSPMLVVKLLNSIYTTFDGVLEKFDVYKVETIGDAYMESHCNVQNLIGPLTANLKIGVSSNVFAVLHVQVASGLPHFNGDKHVTEICSFAIAMQRTMQTFCATHYVHEEGFSLQLRVGLHCGPCVAGVVGVTLPRYCLFGDTINTASRMQSTGEAKRIQASDAMRALAESHFPAKFEWHERGEVDVKGLGLITTHWLTY